jgi:cytochrome c oxidase subunit I+III
VPIDQQAVAPPPSVGLEERLHSTWREPGGFFGWFTKVHHTSTGTRFIFTAFIFFLLGGLLAVFMRLQLAHPENRFLSVDKYNQFFTVHGSTMIFLFAVPLMFQGFGIYLVPLIVGSRNIAFPRLAAFSYWIYLFGCLFFWVGLVLNIGADRGWFAYVTLSGPDYSPGKRVDFWAQMVTFTETSALTTAVCLATTILKHRAPGMSLNRMPIILWEKLVLSFMVIFAMPAVMISSTMLLLDRTVGTQFFNPAEGGDVLLYQHLFWFFGHPDVYIIFLPGTAIITTLVTAFARRHIFGYIAIVVSTISIGFIAFGVWVHHMFATGLPQMGESFFTAATLMIVIPTAVQFFCWISTIWNGRLQFKFPMWWVAGFFFVFMIGGLSGLMLASVPVDTQVHDTFFVVAHFHYVLIGGAVFPMFGGLYYWLPKMTGRMMNVTLGKWNFWLFFIGFNLTFFTMHFLGLRGMTRRVYTYLPEMNWGPLNMVATVGAFLMGAGVLVFIVNFFWSRTYGEIAGPNPWQAGSLEWATSSPPPSYNFGELPTVNGREALWDAAPHQPVVTGIASDYRETLITDTLDADPDHRMESPGPSAWPFWSAVAISIFFIGSVFSAKTVPYTLVPVAITLIGWWWPKWGAAQRRKATEVWSA